MSPFRALLNQSAWVGLSTLQLHAASRRLHRNRALVLMYHGVVPDGRPYFNWGQLTEWKFRWQLDYIRSRYQVLPLDRIVEMLAAGERLPPHTAAITFDDGYANNVTVAAPLLRERGMPASIFLVTDYIGTDRLLWPDEVFVLMQRSEAAELDLRGFRLDRYPLHDPPALTRSYASLMTALKSLTAVRKEDVLEHLRRVLPPSPRRPDVESDFRLMSWDQARALSSEGLISLGAHTRTHEILTRISRRDAREQIEGSCREVRRQLGVERVAFAYPNGSTADFDPFIREVLSSHGATCGLSTIEGLNPKGVDPYSLRRISVGADSTKSRFKLKTSGFIPMLQRLRATLSGHRPAALPEPSLTASVSAPLNAEGRLVGAATDERTR